MTNLVLPCDPDVSVVPVFYTFVAYKVINVKHRGLLTYPLLSDISPFYTLHSYHPGMCV